MDLKTNALAILEALESRDVATLTRLIDDRYVQHNPQVPDGLSGLLGLLDALPPGELQVRPVRVFQDGEYVFVHSEYVLGGPKVGFDIFRFENGRAVEHWDNLQARPESPNPSGRTMLDGPVAVGQPERTEANRQLVRDFVHRVLIGGELDALPEFIAGERYAQHNPEIADGLSGLQAAFQALAEAGLEIRYTRNHLVLAEGDFVLAVSEGRFGDRHVAFYDLFRVEDGYLVEHWDVIAEIPPRSEWANPNGKF